MSATPTAVLTFEPALAVLLPETHALLCSANLVVHPAVARIVLAGSRGPAGGYRPDSDVDLSLVVETRLLPSDEPQRAALLRDVLRTTLDHWQGPVEADLAAVFERREGGLRAFDVQRYDAVLFPSGEIGFGVYKIQKGFTGYVPAHILQPERMYPCLLIWRRRGT